MKPLEVLAESLSPDGTDIKLTRRDREYIILANGKSLMSSRMHGSEEALATFACRKARTMEQPCVLIGGLGMGFTLRATLDLLPSDSMVVVAELLPEMIAWNRGPLGPLAGHPLRDKRVQVDVSDVAVTLSSNSDRFDAALLDVDNGPSAFAASINSRLYADWGIGRRPHGPEERRRSCGLVRPQRPKIRATPQLCWLYGRSAPSSRAPEEGRTSPYGLLRAQNLRVPAWDI